MIILDAGLPDDLRTFELLESKLIPCMCRISGMFEIEFTPPTYPESEFGIVREWEIADIEDQIIPWVGGRYYSINHGQITIERIENSAFKIVDLLLYTPGRDYGWHPVILDGIYGPSIWQDE